LASKQSQALKRDSDLFTDTALALTHNDTVDRNILSAQFRSEYAFGQ